MSWIDTLMLGYFKPVEVVGEMVLLLTFPIFELVFVYPEVLIAKLYGEQYVSGATALHILAVGFIANSYFGFDYHLCWHPETLTS